MSYTDLITIAIPCFERKEYFLEALESTLNQTVKCKIIVVDNCSSHNYFETVCKEFNVTYYRNVANIGLFPNIDRCFELAKTKYVKILDDDDLLSPLYIESFLKAISNYPEIDVYFSDYAIVSSKGEIQHNDKLSFGYMKTGHKIFKYGIHYNLGFPYMSCAFKKSKVVNSFEKKDNHGGYDWIWIYSNADRLSFYGDQQKLYSWRVHDNQIHNKKWIAHNITSPYIYDKILPVKIKDPILLKIASRKANLALIHLKSGCKKEDLRIFLNSENIFSEYLKSKLNNSILLKIIFVLPARISYILLALYLKLNNIKKRFLVT